MSDFPKAENNITNCSSPTKINYIHENAGLKAFAQNYNIAYNV